MRIRKGGGREAGKSQPGPHQGAGLSAAVLGRVPGEDLPTGDRFYSAFQVEMKGSSASPLQARTWEVKMRSALAHSCLK